MIAPHSAAQPSRNPSRILDAASRCFGRLGYAASSMDRVAAEAGVSKTTVYAHFGDKATLFDAAIRRELASFEDRAVRPATTRAEMIDAIVEVSRSYLDWLLTEPRFGLLQAAAAETMRRPEWGQTLFADLEPGALARWLRELSEQGVIGAVDPDAAAELHHAALKGLGFYPVLLGLIAVPGPTDRDRMALASAESLLATLEVHSPVP